MQMRDVFDRLRQFDAYPKTLEDFRIKTFGGAIGKFTKIKLKKIFFKFYFFSNFFSLSDSDSVIWSSDSLSICLYSLSLFLSIPLLVLVQAR